MLLVPQPQSNYRGNYTSFPASTLKAPVEGNRTIPAEIFWTRDASSPSYTVAFNLRSQQVLSLSQICALHIDNTACSSTVNILFPDTHFQLALDAGLEGFYPVITSGLEFFAWVSVAPTSTEHTVIQILNFLPPPMEFGVGAGGGVAAGTVRTVATGAGLTGGPITDTGTVSLVIPVAISSGGTSAVTSAAALDNLSGASGATTGSLTRSGAGTWSVNPAGTGSVTSVVAGTGLTGGTITTTGTIALVSPVAIANGGTGATTAPNALLQLGAAPLNSPGLTGIPTAPNPPNGTNSTQIATTNFVVNSLGSAGFGTISGVVAGNGLSGGGTSGSVTVGIAAPVSVANGGTGATTNTTALTNLGAVAKVGDTMTGTLMVNRNASPPPAGQGGDLMAVGANGANAVINMQAFGVGGTPFLVANYARGTAAAPTAVQNGDVLLNIAGTGYAATGWGTFSSGGAYLQATDNFTATAQGTQWIFVTRPAGTTGFTNSLTLAGNTATFSGRVGLAGQAVPADALPSNLVGASDGLVASTAGAQGATLASNLYMAGSGWKYHVTGAGTLMQAAPLGLSWWSAPSGSGGGAATITQIATLDTAGNYTILGATATKPGGGSWTAPSERALKEDIEPYEAGLAALTSLKPCRYRYASDTGLGDETHIGLVHDETTEMPELHRRLRLLSRSFGDEGREVEGLDYTALTFALINAVKELKERLDQIGA